MWCECYTNEASFRINQTHFVFMAPLRKSSSANFHPWLCFSPVALFFGLSHCKHVGNKHYHTLNITWSLFALHYVLLILMELCLLLMAWMYTPWSTCSHVFSLYVTARHTQIRSSLPLLVFTTLQVGLVHVRVWEVLVSDAVVIFSWYTLSMLTEDACWFTMCADPCCCYIVHFLLMLIAKLPFDVPKTLILVDYCSTECV